MCHWITKPDTGLNWLISVGAENNKDEEQQKSLQEVQQEVQQDAEPGLTDQN